MATPHPFGPVRLIADPRAGRGRVRANLPDLVAAMAAAGLEVDVAEVTAAGQGAVAAREALDEGVRYLVAAGGDPVVHEVVNGMVEVTEPGGDGDPVLRPVVDDAVLGLAAAGSSADFVRTFGLDRSLRVVVRHLASDTTMPVDLGVVEYRDTRGGPARRVFANLAEVGYGGDVVRRAERMPRALGRVRWLLAAYASIRAVDRSPTAVEVAHTTVTVPVVNLVVANGQFVAGGMKVAPRALPDDGRYNVLVFTGQRSQVFTSTTAIYRGEHLPSPDIVEFQSPTVDLAPQRPLPISVDGVPIGTTPARFSLLERAVQLKV